MKKTRIAINGLINNRLNKDKTKKTKPKRSNNASILSNIFFKNLNKIYINFVKKLHYYV